MESHVIEQGLKTLQHLYPIELGDKPHPLPLESIKGLPIWMRENIRLWVVPTRQAETPLYLVIPRHQVEFEHLMRIHKLLQEKLGPLVLIIADQMPPKHRPLLVKFRIPFIYKNESIFAPILGLKFSNFKKFESHPKPELTLRKENLSPFALKLLAGFLTNQIPFAFTQKNLLNTLKGKTKISASKLSSALVELVERDLLKTHGAGPTKTYTQENHQRLWEKLYTLPLAPLFKEVETNYIPKRLEDYIVAGESALASYSQLAHPGQNTIAVTTNEFRLSFLNVGQKFSNLATQGTTLVQIWKEDPALFSVEGVQNPIEVFFALQKNQDERVQLSLHEMFKKFDLHLHKE